ncbi:hypothetical protein H6Y29_000861 [Escherichia coli]|nr:hypothetical protein [Escherichia coli]EGF1713886.1 hypothetical protein [Escherichia coli]
MRRHSVIRWFSVVRFTSRGREYEVDERLITTIDKHRSEKDAHHIHLTDGTYFCATNVVRVNLIRQVQESRR